MIERSIDPVDNIIHVVSIGAATRADIDAHYAAMRGLIATMRAEEKPIRVLSDQTNATRLPEELNQHIKALMESLYQPGDRVALLMATNDDKMYVRSVLGTAEYAAFDSRIAAEMWLMEPALKPPSD